MAGFNKKFPILIILLDSSIKLTDRKAIPFTILKKNPKK